MKAGTTWCVCGAVVAALLGSADLPSGLDFRDGIARVHGKALVTHARRDIIPAPGPLIVRAAERELFEHPERFWEDLEKSRFHDYAQKGTKVPVRPLTVSRSC